MASPKDRIDRIAVIGGGLIGRGIAWAASLKGIKVSVVEISAEAAERSKLSLSADLDEAIERWGIADGDKRAVLGRTTFGHDPAAVAGARLVIEAVTEDEETKLAIFSRIEKSLPASAIVATTAATFSITDLARRTNFAERFLGLRFAMPVSSRPLVEVIRGLQTSQKTFQFARAFILGLGKTPVEVFESTGAITIRGIVPLLNEAMHMLMEGVASAEDIDLAMKLAYDLKHGPLEMADRIGLDDVLAWMEQLSRETLDPKYRPCPILKKLVRAGKLGDKTGEGFINHQSSIPSPKL